MRPLTFLLGGVLFLLSPAAHGFQRPGRIVIFDQPIGARGSNIDLTDYVSRELSIAAFEPMVFKPHVPAVKEAVAAGKLSTEDFKQPLSPETSRKIAGALGFRQLLRVSGRSTPDGVAADAELERLAGQQSWSSVSVVKLEAYKPRGSKPSLLEGIKAQVALIVQRITGAPGQVTTQDPIAVKVAPNDPRPAPKNAAPPEKTDPPVSSLATAGTSKPPAANPIPSAPRPNYDLIADRYRRDGDHANLIIVLRKAVNDQPREVRLRKELIEAYLARGWSDAARDEAARAVALSPSDAGLRRILGEAYLKSGDTDAALREMSEAIKANPKDAASLVALGDIYLASAKVTEAEKAFVDASLADPAHPLPHRRLARLYADRGQLSAALKSISSVRAGVKDENADSLLPDYVGILGILEAALSEVLTRVQTNRQAVTDGKVSREIGFSNGTAQRKRAEEIAAFLDAMPSIPSLDKIQSLYGQAAGFVIQSAEATLLFLETQDSKRDQEAALLRLEAVRALSDASKRLKAASTPAPSPTD